MQFITVLLLCVFLPASIFGASDYRPPEADSKISHYLDIAAFFKESGEYEKAKGVLETTGTLNRDIRSSRLLGRLDYLSGNSKQALEILDRDGKNNWLDSLYLGLACEDLGRVRAAIKYYKHSLRFRKTSVALFRLGKIHRQRREYRTAIRYFLALIDWDPSIRPAYYYLGQCFYNQSRHEKAYKYLAKAIRFYPENTEMNTLLGKVKNKLGRSFFQAKRAKVEKERRRVKLPYYIPQEGIPSIRVGLGEGLEKISFSCPGDFVVSDSRISFKGKKENFYTIVFTPGKITLKDYAASIRYASFSLPVKITALGTEGKRAPFYILDLSYGQKTFWHKRIDRAYRGDLELLNSGKGFTLVNILSVEAYLCGVLAAEMPSKSNPQALQAQAVAARTFAVKNRNRHENKGFDLCADVHCQFYQGLSVETAATTRAVNKTRGEILAHNRRPIETLYHSNCGGCLASDTFGQHKYLANKLDRNKGLIPASSHEEEMWFLEAPSAFCARGANSKFRWQRIYDQEDFLIAFGFDLTDLRQVAPKAKGECFHYKEIEVITASGKKKLSGDFTIRNFFDRLRSSAFKLEIKRSAQGSPQLLIFWGAGFGHGSGLCQEGALAMAKEGFNYRQILKHYYPKAELINAY